MSLSSRSTLLVGFPNLKNCGFKWAQGRTDSTWTLMSLQTLGASISFFK